MLEIFKFGFATFLNSSGHQNRPALLASDRRSMMEMELREGYMVIVDDKDKSYIKCSGKDGCVTVFYLVSG